MGAVTGDPKFAWVDIETTGLDPCSHYILEVGLVVTDVDLNVTTAFTTPILVGDLTAHDWIPNEVRKMHTANNLFAECQDKDRALDLGTAQDALVEVMFSVFGNDTPPMCGSSVHFDRGFLERHMPVFAERFHYRNIDISTVRELAQAWRPEVAQHVPTPSKEHRVLPDLMDTLDLARTYKSYIFNPPF